MRTGIPQARLLAELVRVWPDSERAEVLRETLELLGQLVDQEYRVEILLKLGPCLPDEQLQRILPDICELWDEGDRAHALRELLAYLPAEQLPAFLEVVLVIKNEEQRAALLLQVIPRLPTNLLASVLESVQAIWDEGLRVEILARLVPFTNAELRPRLLELIEGIKDPGYGVWFLAELEASLGSSQSNPDIAEVFRDVRYADERIQTLLAIVERVSDEALARIFTLMEPEIFGFYRSILKAEHQADIFIKLAPRMPEAWLKRTLHLIRGLEKETYQSQALVALAPRIDEKLLPGVLDTVRAMKAREQRARVLEALVLTLPAESKGQRVREMLQVLQVIKDENDRSTLFESFTGELENVFPVTRVPEILSAVEAMHSEVRQAHILSLLVGIVSTDQYETILQAAGRLWSEDERSRVLLELAPRLPETALASFLAVVQRLQEEHWRARVLEALAKRLPPATLPAFLALVWEIQDESKQTRILAALATNPPPATFPVIWDASQRIQQQGNRVLVLSALAEHVLADYFVQFWEAARAIEHQDWQMRTMVTLARHLPAHSFPRIWSALQENTDQQWQGRAIMALAPFVPEAFYSQVFQVAQTISATQIRLRMHNALVENTDGPENALEALADVVPESFFLSFWQQVNALEEKWQQTRLRERLVERVPDNLFATIWNEVDRVEEGNAQRDKLWERLANRQPERFFDQIWEAVKNLESQVLQQRMLLVLSWRVPDRYIPQFWQVVKMLKNGQKQAQILIELVPNLPREMLMEVVDVSMEGASPRKTHVNVLKWLIAFLNEEQRVALLDRLLPAQWQEEHDLAEIFTSLWKKQEWWEQIMLVLVPQLPAELSRVILPAFLKVELNNRRVDEDRKSVLIELVGYVPESELPNVLEAIWAMNIAYAQEHVLAALLDYSRISSSVWTRVLELAIAKMQATGEARYLLQVLSAAPVALQQTAPQQLYLALRAVLRTMAQRPRRAALADLTFLESTLRALGGEETIISAVSAVLEIGCWWP